MGAESIVRIKIVGLQQIPKDNQQLVGQWILQVIHYANIEVDGVTVKFEEEKDEEEMDEQRMEPTLMSDRDVRVMRYEREQLGLKIKGLQKTNGRLGTQIHELRCELAEVREINGKIARGELRELQREVNGQATVIVDQRQDIELLKDRNRVLREKLAARETFTNGGSDV